ncbi:Cullin repeat-like-containing domain protein [Xylogone sp. PMI_703]|nr:Cullin repeat-like-containing domain protein [Xylogone sp. PMI_703]
MAVGPSARHTADEEARAEVEVLNSRLEKTNQLTKKIQASLARLESTGKSVQDAIGPIYGHTQKLQTLGTNIEGILAAIDKVRQPSDIKNNEEDIIKAGPVKAGLSAFLASLQRVSNALTDMKKTNLRSNQQAQADLAKLLKSGNTQLEAHFQILLQEDSRPVEPLHYLTKDKPFPLLSQDKTTRLGLINSYIASAARQSQFTNESPVLQTYANVRGPYLTATLQNLSSASINTAKKTVPDAVYKQGTNGIGTYAKAMEGAFLSEYDNICALFSRDEWSKVFNLTCQSAVAELARTLRELNMHIKANLTTDCYLAYEIIEIMSNLSSNLENRTGELKPSFAAALKPIRETAKSSLGELLEDTRRRVNSLQIVPQDGAPVMVTTETVNRLQTMVNFLGPISSVMISLGDGNWKPGSTSNGTLDGIPSLNSFDISADGKEIFSHYCIDTVDALLTALEAKGKLMLKSKQTLGVFIANNATIVDRMIRRSELQPLLESRTGDIDKWRKTGTQLYTMAWREPSAHLLDVQYTNRGARPTSGHASAIDSAAILKGLSTKDKDSIKEKFRLFNASFDELIAKHKSLHLEPEVKDLVAKQVQQMIEPLYGRFWDRYHEVDKGKGKYVKYDKTSISAAFASLG